MISILVTTLLSQNCVVRDSANARGARMSIALTTGTNEPWGVLQGGDVTATIRSPHDIEVTALTSGLRFTSHATAMQVFTDTPTAFAKGFLSGMQTSLSIKAVDGQTVTVGPLTRSDVEPAARWQDVAVDCSHLRLNASDSGRSWRGPELPEGTVIHEAANGKAIFTLLEPVHASPGEQHRGWTQVTLQLGDGAQVSGWINRRFKRGESESAGGVGRTIFCSAGRSEAQRDCGFDLEVFIRHGGAEPIRLGTHQRNSAFGIVRRDAKWVTIAIHELPLSLREGWSLVVSADALERCGVVPSP